MKHSVFIKARLNTCSSMGSRLKNNSRQSKFGYVNFILNLSRTIIGIVRNRCPD